MKTLMDSTIKCWCGNEELEYFSEKYLKCIKCGTLVSAEFPVSSIYEINDDDSDFYGRNYWFSHQENDYGFPNIIERSRNDLHERCIYWLKTVLKYKLPPGRTLELGCSHGGFVAMLKWAGYDAVGIELSPWIAEFARNAFDVQIFIGQVEAQNFEKDSLSLIILMDVLEHLVNPLETLHYCSDLLKKDGVFVIQTPQLDEESVYQDMVDNQSPFLNQLKEKDHLYLFSKNSITKMLNKIGYDHIYFEEAIFKHYDMFLFASRTPIKEVTKEEQIKTLTSKACSKMVLALLDLDNSKSVIQGKLNDAEEDRLKRLEVIQRQGQQIGRIDSERNTLQALLNDLRQHLESVELDRTARLEVIQDQGQRLGLMESERNNLQAQLADLRKHFEAVESDRADRLKVIQEQGQQLGLIESERNNLHDQLADLRQNFEKIKEEQYKIKVQLDKINYEKDEAFKLLDTLTNSFIYKTLRKFGFWK